jgi:hypothetical protein
MKRLLFLGTMCLLTACDSLQSSSKVASPSPSTSVSLSPTPTPSSEVGPLSSSTPSPSPSGSPIASGGDAANLPSGLLSPSATPSVTPNNPNIAGNNQKSPVSGVKPSAKTNANDASVNPDMQISQLYGLDNNNASPKGDSPKTSQTPVPTKTSTASVTPTISADGMGGIRLGMTIGELKKMKGYTIQTKSAFATGYSALAVSQKGKVQFYIPYARQKPITDKDQVRFLVTENPTYKTDQGVGPGMTLKQVSQIYGQPVLQLQKEAESGEILAFARQPQSMAFSTGRSATKVGIYPKVKGKIAVQTNKYNENAKIKRITVVCPDTVCGAEQQ